MIRFEHSQEGHAGGGDHPHINLFTLENVYFDCAIPLEGSQVVDARIRPLLVS